MDSGYQGEACAFWLPLGSFSGSQVMYVAYGARWSEVWLAPERPLSVRLLVAASLPSGGATPPTQQQLRSKTVGATHPHLTCLLTA